MAEDTPEPDHQHWRVDPTPPPAIVRPYQQFDEHQQRLIAHAREQEQIGNAARWEAADAYVELRETGMTLRQIAQAVGKSHVHIGYCLKAVAGNPGYQERPDFQKAYEQAKAPKISAKELVEQQPELREQLTTEEGQARSRREVVFGPDSPYKWDGPETPKPTEAEKAGVGPGGKRLILNTKDEAKRNELLMSLGIETHGALIDIDGVTMRARLELPRSIKIRLDPAPEVDPPVVIPRDPEGD